MIKRILILPLFICRDLGTTQYACQDKQFLATIFVMETSQNIQELKDTGKITEAIFSYN